ncbi:hypothetical protein DICPUDRAFT_41497, partial [Dictyostelium purpureum]
DLSDSTLRDAWCDIRDDDTETNWMLLGYGSYKKTLQLYGTGSGGLKEMIKNLKEEVMYGYLRTVYGDSDRAKFVFITYVPDSLSGIAKAKANMHKPHVDRFFKYNHAQFQVMSIDEISEEIVHAKLKAASGANY